MEYNVLYEQFQQQLDARLKSEHPIDFDALIEEASPNIPPKINNQVRYKVSSQIMSNIEELRQEMEDAIDGITQRLRATTEGDRGHKETTKSDIEGLKLGLTGAHTTIEDLKKQIDHMLQQQKQTQQKQTQQKPNVSRKGDDRYSRYDSGASPFAPRYTSSKRDKSRKSSKSRRGFWRNIQSGLDMLGKTSPTTKIM